MGTSDFIPKQLKELPLYVKISSIVDDIRNENSVELRDILSKYKDFSIISDEAVQEVIKEFGYQYITDVLNLNSSEKKTLLSFLSLIHFLKGHLRGLEVVLNFLNVAYTITPWHQQIPTGTPHTFQLDIDLNASNIPPNVIERLKSFVKQYVFPKMDIVLNFDLDAQLETGIIGVYDVNYTGLANYSGTGHGFNFGQSFGDDSP